MSGTVQVSGIFSLLYDTINFLLMSSSADRTLKTRHQDIKAPSHSNNKKK